MSVKETLGRLGLVLPTWCPVSTYLLVLNGSVMLVLMALFGAGNLFRPEPLALFRMGALDPSQFLAGEYWRLITYGFLHIGLLHIAFNLLSLSQVGPVLEQQVGSARFFCVYMLSLIGGGVADVLVRGDQPMLIAGASGALFGLIGFGLSYAHFYGGPAGRAQRDFFLHWAAYGFVFGYIVRADNICHLGGFAVGVASGFLVERERVRRDAFAPVWQGLAWLCALAIAGAFAWMAWVESGRTG
jgi:rhomboid protease GluP